MFSLTSVSFWKSVTRAGNSFAGTLQRRFSQDISWRDLPDKDVRHWFCIYASEVSRSQSLPVTQVVTSLYLIPVNQNQSKLPKLLTPCWTV
jgi:hypothetical protein